MNLASNQTKQFLSWHRSCQKHPIFNLIYAKENLASLAETIVLPFAYFAATIILFHTLVLAGFFEAENFNWLLLERGARILMFWASAEQFQNIIFVSITLVALLVIILISRRAFNVLKANLHPKSKQLYKVYTATKTAAK